MKGPMAWNDLRASIHEMADDIWNNREASPEAQVSPRPEGESAAGLAQWVTRVLGRALLEKQVNPEGLNARVYRGSCGPSGTRWYVDVILPGTLAPSLWDFIREKLGEGNFFGTVYEGKVSFQFYPLGGAGNTAVAHF